MQISLLHSLADNACSRLGVVVVDRRASAARGYGTMLEFGCTGPTSPTSQSCTLNRRLRRWNVAQDCNLYESHVVRHHVRSVSACRSGTRSTSGAFFARSHDGYCGCITGSQAIIVNRTARGAEMCLCDGGSCASSQSRPWVFCCFGSSVHC